ncbi:MAG TPA: PH domain-containing protein, partial [Streptosporangiaceae bacterium]
MTVPGLTGTGPGEEEASQAAPLVAAATAAPAAGGFADPDARWQRLSPRSMVVRPLTDLARLLPLLAGLLVLHSRTGGSLLWGVLASVFAVATGLVHWATTRYLITDERVYVRHGLLNQKRLSVARDRIRTVDVTAHLLHRMLGVCRVSIGTGRNDFRSGESFHLDGLTRAEADSLRVLLLAGDPGQARGAQAMAGQTRELAGDRSVPPASAGTPVAAGPPAGGMPVAGPAGQLAGTGRELVRLRLSWLRFAPLTLAGLVILGILAGSVVQLNNATDINLARTSPVRLTVAHFAALSVAQRVLVGSAVAIAVYVVIAMAGYIAVYWNFRLAGQDAGTLRVTRGLLSLRATTISLSRLRGVEISESLLLRAARGARCVAITTGLRVGRGAEHEGSVLVPPAPRAVSWQVAAAVLGIPEDLCSGALERHGPAARRRRYIRALAGAVVVVALAGAATWAQHGSAWTWAASLALLPAAAAVAADRYRSLGHRLADGWLVTRTGALARRRCIIATDAIIGWRIHQTWFQRRQGLMTLTATT